MNDLNSLSARIKALEQSEKRSGVLVDYGLHKATLHIYNPNEKFEFDYETEDDLLKQVKALNLNSNLVLHRFYNGGLEGVKELTKEDFIK